MEKSDEVIKKKHKEFNGKVKALFGKENPQVLSPALQRLRSLAQYRKPTLQRPYGV